MQSAPNTISSQTNPRSTTGLATLRDIGGQNAGVVHYKTPKDPAALLREANELRRTAELAISVPGISAIELVDVDEGQRRLLTRHIEGTSSLFNYLWNRSGLLGSGRFYPLPLAEGGRRIGLWLRKYHNSVSHETDRATVLELTQRYGLGKLKRLREIAPRFLSKSLCDALTRRFESPSISNLANERLTTIHGDFTLANIPYNDRGELFVLDFADTRVGFPLEDYVRCWHAAWNIAAVSPVRNKRLKPFLDALADAYGLPAQVAQSSLFQLFLIWNALTQILTTMSLRMRFGYGTYVTSIRMAQANRRMISSLLSQA